MNRLIFLTFILWNFGSAPYTILEIEIITKIDRLD